MHLNESVVRSAVHNHRIAYVCDRKRACRTRPSCQVDCFHTTDPKHAEFGPVIDGDDLVARFVYYDDIEDPEDVKWFEELWDEDERC